MEKFKTRSDTEILLEKVEQKVLKAKKNAPDLELLQLKSINKKNEEEISILLKNGTICTENLLEFSLALEALGMSEEEVVDHLAHENAHANKTESLGAEHLGYNITLIRNGNGFLIQPYSHIYIPDEWSSKKYKETMRKVLMAPEEYGNKLSPDDVEKLKNLLK